jgi:hypothetical protein
MAVEFLSGCNMAYRRAVLDELRFDERLSGYALGEDLAFSYAVSRRWRLVLTPAARLDHRHVGRGRPDPDAYQAMAVFNRYLFFREQIARGWLDWMCWAWANVGSACLVLRAPRRRGARGLLRGYRAVARHLMRGDLPSRDRPAADPVSAPAA